MKKNNELTISIENSLLKKSLENAIFYLVETSNELAKTLRLFDEFDGTADFGHKEKSDIEGQLEYINLILMPYDVNNLRHLFSSLYIRFENIQKQRQRILNGSPNVVGNNRQTKVQSEVLDGVFEELNRDFVAFYQVVIRAYNMINSKEKTVDAQHDLDHSEQKHRFLDHFHKKQS